MPKILLIHDQPYAGEVLLEELAPEGYQVTRVGDAQSATRYLEDSKPYVVPLDLDLKGFEGWDVLRSIKSKDQSLPVFV
jgi:DNA-binding response OmpR family regulator